MSTQILAILVVSVAFFQIGCSKESNKSKIEKAQAQAAINACMFDPTGACQQKAKLMMENPQLASQINAVAATSVQNGGTGVVQKTADGSIVPVLPQSIKEQAMKVQAALQADSNNPRSLHYDPPQSQVVADRTPASTAESSSAAGGTGVQPSSAPATSTASNGETFK